MSKSVFQKKEYETRTYEELLSRFHLHLCRAIEIIPMMYDRLTLKDGYTHKHAMSRMRNDLSGIRGFSPRNIIRFLPSDNPIVPRRVRAVTPKWRKSSDTNTQLPEQQADSIKDAERKIDEMTSKIIALREQIDQYKVIINLKNEETENTLIRLEKAENLLAWTQKKLGTRESQLKEAIDAKQTWEFLACYWFIRQEENEMAHRVTQQELQTRDSQPREANEKKQTWEFLACYWCITLQEHKMAVRRILNEVLEHNRRLKRIEANTPCNVTNVTTERVTQGIPVNSLEEADIAAILNHSIMEFISVDLKERGLLG